MDEMGRTITSTSVREIAPGSWRVEKERSLKRRSPLRRLPVLFFWVFEKDNSSGLPENAETFKIPVKFK